MASQVFYRKWRSQTLSELVGQPHVTQTLLNALKNSNISHAYLFCGPRGTGKTSTARILAKAINCLKNEGRGEPCNECEMCRAVIEDRALDIIEIDAASNRGIDDIRDLREKVNYAPVQARRKVYIIDEFHMLSKDASNALLKTLEEPPPHVVFILATTEAHKVLPTILSRCQHFDFHRLSRADVISQLGKVAAGENIKIDNAALNLIARSTTGSMRDAENLLEQLTTFYGNDIHIAQVQSMLGITGDWRAKEIVKHIIDHDISSGMAVLNSVNNDGLDLRQFNRELVDYLRNLLLIKTGAVEAVDLTAEDINELKDIAAKAALPQILNAVKLFGQVELGNADNSTLPLELALVDTYLAQESAPAQEQKAKPSTVSPAAPLVKPAAVKTEARTTIPAEKEVRTNPPAAKKENVKEASQEVPVKEKPTNDLAEATAEPVKVETKEPPSVKEPAAAAAPGGDLERLRSGWRQLLDTVPANLKKTNAIALLRSGGIRPVALEKDFIVLAAKYTIHKETMEKSENQKVAEKIFSDFLGHPCKIRCICEGENNLVKSAIKLGGQVTSVEEK
jgi:DNA polymerase III subunit gamma/tau